MLKPKEERRLQAGHLWVFSNEVDTAATPLTAFAPGAHVTVRSSSDRFLGYAYVNPQTLISARVVGRDPAFPPGKSLLVHRLKVALALRQRLFSAPFYRLAYGEGDFLPGLVIDRYGDVLVAQLDTAGMDAMKADVEEALAKVVAPRALLWKNDSPMRELEGLERRVDSAFGEVPESGRCARGRSGLPRAARRQARRPAGISTRPRIARCSRGMPVAPGCSTYSVMRAGSACRRCVRARRPRPASTLRRRRLPAASATADANGLDVELLEGDGFEALEALVAERRRFDAIVVDPPAFIKRKKDHPKGLAAYRRINLLAMQLLDRDGLLMSCSCSYHLAPGELVDAVQRAARHRDRFAQLLAVGGQSPDHPVHPAIDETRYLRAPCSG